MKTAYRNYIFRQCSEEELKAKINSKINYETDKCSWRSQKGCDIVILDVRFQSPADARAYIEGKAKKDGPILAARIHANIEDAGIFEWYAGGVCSE